MRGSLMSVEQDNKSLEQMFDKIPLSIRARNTASFEPSRRNKVKTYGFHEKPSRIRKGFVLSRFKLSSSISITGGGTANGALSQRAIHTHIHDRLHRFEVFYTLSIQINGLFM